MADAVVTAEERESLSRGQVVRRYVESLLFTARGRQVFIIAMVGMVWGDVQALLYGTQLETIHLLGSWTDRDVVSVVLIAAAAFSAVVILWMMDVYQDEVGAVVDDG